MLWLNGTQKYYMWYSIPYGKYPELRIYKLTFCAQAISYIGFDMVGRMKYVKYQGASK